MSLYLCIFENDIDGDELEGVEVGAYSDFAAFRKAINRVLERGPWGRFPTLMNHHDSDGSWSPADAAELTNELRQISEDPGGSIATTFVDVEGQPLVERLRALAQLAVQTNRPIWFQ